MRRHSGPLRRVAAALLLAGLLSGCVVGLLPGENLFRSELIFGRGKPDGSTVSDAEWRTFVAEHVAPRFPAGFTVVDGGGQYRDRSGRVIAEPTKIILLIHDGGEGALAAIEAIRSTYRQLFDQESVILISAPARASF